MLLQSLETRLHGHEASAFRWTQRARSVGEKASVFNRLFERPESWRHSDKRRRAHAEEAYRNSFSDGPTSPTTTAGR